MKQRHKAAQKAQTFFQSQLCFLCLRLAATTLLRVHAAIKVRVGGSESKEEKQ
jgi:hypothetical protein